MAAPVKKRAVNLGEEKASKGNKNESETDNRAANEEQIVDNVENEVIQVGFEGRNPIDSDFHGIKQLLSQLFLKAHLNLTELTNLIISQNYIGSVIKQSGEEEEDDEEDEDDDADEVFGISTVVNLTDKQKLECVQQLRSLLLELCTEHGSDEVITLVRSLLTDNSKSVGLLINERFVNIPPQIVVPMLKSLRSELRKAVEKKMAFDFSYFILICKLYKAELGGKNKSKKNKETEQEIVWSNPEEEIIDKVAEARFEFSVEKESDSGLSGQWKETDDQMTPMRRVLFLPASKLNEIIEKIEKEVIV